MGGGEIAAMVMGTKVPCVLTSRGDSSSPNSTRSHWLVWPLNNSGIGFMGFKILAINPGSTSTKIALYDDEQPTLALTLRHSAEEIARFPRIIDQLDWRKEMVLEALAKNNFDVKSLSAVIGRGGLIKPIESGVYEVNAALKNDLVNAQREHASNLAA
mgnify:FL=1